MPAIRSRRGVTLAELVVALAIAGFTMLGGILLLDQVDDSARRIIHTAVNDSRSGNGERMLRRLLADAQTTLDSTSRFQGDARNIVFHTLCDVPSGWAESCVAQLAIDSLRDSSLLIAQLANGDQLVVRRMAGAARFGFFDLAGGDSMWRQRWGVGTTLPVAIGLVGRGDTTVLLVGPSRE